MSTSRKRLGKGISAASFVEGAAPIRAALTGAQLGLAIRLSYGSNDAAAVQGIGSFAVPDRPHFMVQGQAAVEAAALADHVAAAARSTANFEQPWGSWLFSLARDHVGKRSLSFSRIVQPGGAAPSFVDRHVAPVLRNEGAVEAHGCLRLERGVWAEMWGGDQERLQAHELAPGEAILDRLVDGILAGIGESRRVLLTLKSHLAHFESWVAAEIVRPASDFQPFASFELEVGDWRSNVEPERLAALAGKLDAELSNSEGVLELVVLEGDGDSAVPVAALHFGWSRRGTEVAWVPITRDRRELQRAWSAIETVTAF